MEPDSYKEKTEHEEKKDEISIPEGASAESQEALTNILNEVRYLRQEVDFLKKIVKTENTATRKY